jgi:predicted GNAT family N-acyltransferase
MASPAPQHEFRIEEITGTDVVPLTYELRHRVWSKEIQLIDAVQNAGLICDEHDSHARHWAVFAGEQIVAAARMCIHDRQEETPDFPPFALLQLPRPVATINRLVVHESARKQGLARKLDFCRIDAARTSGAKCIAATCVEQRIIPLERLGFRLTGAQWMQPYASSLKFHAMILSIP